MPRSREERLNRTAQRLANQADPSRPYAQQLEQVASAAVAYGLRRAAHTRAPRPEARSARRAQIETAVEDFASNINQDTLERAARQAHVAPSDALGGVVLKHCHDDLKPLTAEQVARYGLEFALALADTRPILAARYRRWLGKGAASS